MDKIFVVGKQLIYTGKIGSMPAEFRGFYDDNGEKLARVIIRHKDEPPFETSVKPRELS